MFTCTMFCRDVFFMNCRNHVYFQREYRPVTQIHLPLTSTIYLWVSAYSRTNRFFKIPVQINHQKTYLPLTSTIHLWVSHYLRTNLFFKYQYRSITKIHLPLTSTIYLWVSHYSWTNRFLNNPQNKRASNLYHLPVSLSLFEDNPVF
jgi:hypothetical protein